MDGIEQDPFALSPALEKALNWFQLMTVSTSFLILSTGKNGKIIIWFY